MSVLHGNGDGTYRSAISYGVAPGPRSILTADFNRDGRPDLALANNNNTQNPTSNNVSVLFTTQIFMEMT